MRNELHHYLHTPQAGVLKTLPDTGACTPRQVTSPEQDLVAVQAAQQLPQGHSKNHCPPSIITVSPEPHAVGDPDLE